MPLGCPKNLIDSERMLAMLAEGGCVVGAPMEEADVIVINTCAFISAARREARHFIDQALACKRSGSAARVVVAGCLASKEGRELFEGRPEIDAVVAVAGRDEVLSAVTGKGRAAHLAARAGRTARRTSATCLPVRRGSLQPSRLKVADDRGRFRLTPRHTAYLRIAEGCSRGCTYCTIPSIRGPLVSKPARRVLAEARELADDGAVELNVIAQDTTAYGQDLPGSAGACLAGLLRKLDRVDGVEWIRLLYTYPRQFSDELIEAVATCRHIVPYVDMPLQHISDPVLKRMGRGVKRKQIEQLLAKLRAAVGDLTLRTTFIVGFPGETEKEFAELVEFVERFRFEALGVFEYSPEPGTPAAEMPGQVPPEVKAARAEAIMLAQQRIVMDANSNALGRRLRVLVDGQDDQGRTVGRHCGQAPEIDSECLLTRPAPAGSFVQGVVENFEGYDLVVRPEQ